MKLRRMRDWCASRGVNNVKMQLPLFYHLTDIVKGNIADETNVLS